MHRRFVQTSYSSAGSLGRHPRDGLDLLRKCLPATFAARPAFEGAVAVDVSDITVAAWDRTDKASLRQSALRAMPETYPSVEQCSVRSLDTRSSSAQRPSCRSPTPSACSVDRPSCRAHTSSLKTAACSRRCAMSAFRSNSDYAHDASARRAGTAHTRSGCRLARPTREDVRTGHRRGPSLRQLGRAAVAHLARSDCAWSARHDRP